MKRQHKRLLTLTLALTPLLSAGGCRPDVEAGTFDIVVWKVDPDAAGILVVISDPKLTRVVEVGPKLIALDSVPGKPSTKFLLRGPLSVGQTAFMVKVWDRDEIPTVTVLQAARGAAGRYAALNPAAFSFVPFLQTQ